MGLWGYDGCAVSVRGAWMADWRVSLNWMNAADRFPPDSGDLTSASFVWEDMSEGYEHISRTPEWPHILLDPSDVPRTAS